MGVLSRAAKRRRLEESLATDRISSLPDGVLGDIISLLPTKDGARTQVLSSRWRHLWRSAPLNLEVRDLPAVHGVPAAGEVSRILSSHPGPARRFSVFYGDYRSYGANRDTFPPDLGGWLRSPALDKLQELSLYHVLRVPESALHRFSSTLRVAAFNGCIFMAAKNASAPHWPLLTQLSLVNVVISDSYFHALLAACPVLQSLLLSRYCDWDLYQSCNYRDFRRVEIVSPGLVSIGIHSGLSNFSKLDQLVIKDAPCLERLSLLGGIQMDVLVISAPRLHILGKPRYNNFPRFHSDTTPTVQGSYVITSMTTVVSSVKVLALSKVKPCLNVVINLMKCFPHLEKLYLSFQIPHLVEETQFIHQENIGALNIRLRKIVLANYRGYKSEIKFAKFFISNARLLELMRFELLSARVSHNWIEKQRSLLEVKRRASMGAQFDFVSRNILIGLRSRETKVHDLSITDPFQRIHQEI